MRLIREKSKICYFLFPQSQNMLSEWIFFFPKHSLLWQIPHNITLPYSGWKCVHSWSFGKDEPVAPCKMERYFFKTFHKTESVLCMTSEYHSKVRSKQKARKQHLFITFVIVMKFQHSKQLNLKIVTFCWSLFKVQISVKLQRHLELKHTFIHYTSMDI